MNIVKVTNFQSRNKIVIENEYDADMSTKKL